MQHFGTYHMDHAVYDPDKQLTLELYFVEITGEPIPSSEIEEIGWMGKKEYTEKHFPVAPSFDLFISDLIKDGHL